MEQKLIAFWKYDVVPYVLSGEVLSFTPDGKVEVKGYSGLAFTPIKILPFEEGIEIGEKIRKIGKEVRDLVMKIHADCQDEVNRLLEIN